jgi:hypothetical protein
VPKFGSGWFEVLIFVVLALAVVAAVWVLVRRR